MKRIIYTIAMVLILAGGAMAQKSLNRTTTNLTDRFTSALNTFSFSSAGIETTKGTDDYVNNVCWSNTFSITGRDSKNLFQFTISIDYIEAGVGQATDIVGGNWSLAVFSEDKHVGTMFGEISLGSITWDRDSEGNIVRYISAKMRITGGTIEYENVGTNGSGMFNAGSLMVNDKPIVSGTVDILFNN